LAFVFDARFFSTCLFFDLFLASFVYFIEILGIGFTYGYLLPSVSVKKRVWGLTGVILLGFILGIALQNIPS
jgi:hypothetical protein